MFKGVFNHRNILADQVRMAAYEKAIHHTIQVGDVVADIGAGSGVLAFLALQAGASKVYALEQGDIIGDAEKLAAINGLSDRIIFIKGRSDKIELPEKVDVITSEILGALGLEENVHRSMIDARTRFLQPGGRLVPSWLEVHVVPVESDALWEKYVGLWDSGFFGLDFSAVTDHAVQQRYVTDCSTKVSRLAAPSMISHTNFYEIDRMPFLFRGESVISRAGELHGLVGYFRAGLSSDVVLGTPPEEPQTHWRHTFLPMQEAVPVKDGDEVRFQIKAIPQQTTLFWEWNTSVYRDGLRIVEFRQSNLSIPKEEMVVGRSSFRPVLTQKGEIRRRVLDLCDGRRSMAEISELIRAEYPEKYRDLKAAMQEVVGIVRPEVSIQ